MSEFLSNSVFVTARILPGLVSRTPVNRYGRGKPVLMSSKLDKDEFGSHTAACIGLE